MIESRRGNVLEAEAEAIVNTVNCVGVMGKGVALLVKQRYPCVFHEYQRACRAREVRPGQMLTVPTGRAGMQRFVINFPTKRHWQAMSRIEDIRAGLPALVQEIRRLGIRSVAVPALGCGNGGLEWMRVKPLIESALADLPDVTFYLYEPDSAEPNASEQPFERRSEKPSRLASTTAVRRRRRSGAQPPASAMLF